MRFFLCSLAGLACGWVVGGCFLDRGGSLTFDDGSGGSGAGPGAGGAPSVGGGGATGVGGDGGSGGAPCGPTEERCDGVCVDTASNPAHCGGCNTPCNAPSACAGGICGLMCTPGTANCDMNDNNGCEVNLATDPLHCGACNTVVPEVCNGVDDSCDSVVDEGCPAAVTVANGTFQNHITYGNQNGGSSFSNACSGDGIIIGFSGYIAGNLDQIRAICDSPMLVEDTDVMPYAYRIERSGNQQLLPVQGSNVTTAFDITCPAQEFVVGMSGAEANDGVKNVIVHCAELVISGSPGSFSVSHGAVTTIDAMGMSIGAPFMDVLTNDEVVDRYRGAAGSWVDRIGIGETTVGLTLQ